MNSPLPWTCARQCARLSSSSRSPSLFAHARLFAAALCASPTFANLPKRQPDDALAAVVERVLLYPDKICALSLSEASLPLAKPSRCTLVSASVSSRNCYPHPISCHMEVFASLLPGTHDPCQQPAMPLQPPHKRPCLSLSYSMIPCVQHC